MADGNKRIDWQSAIQNARFVCKTDIESSNDADDVNQIARMDVFGHIAILALSLVVVPIISFWIAYAIKSVAPGFVAWLIAGISIY